MNRDTELYPLRPSVPLYLGIVVEVLGNSRFRVLTPPSPKSTEKIMCTLPGIMKRGVGRFSKRRLKLRDIVYFYKELDEPSSKKGRIVYKVNAEDNERYQEQYRFQNLIKLEGYDL